MKDMDERYQRLLDATRDAAQGGYDAVQMRDLAAASRMSLATVYRYCSSKDHLIAEAHADWLERFRADLARRPPTGPDAAARVTDIMRRMCRSLDRHRELTLTILRALYAPEPAVEEARRTISATYAAIVDDAIGADPITDREVVIEVLGYVLDGVLARWANQGLTSAGAARVLEQAATVLLVRRIP